MLRAVAEQTGAEIDGTERLERSVAVHLADMELVPALQQLLDGVDYAIAGGSRPSGAARPTRVIIRGTADPGSRRTAGQSSDDGVAAVDGSSEAPPSATPPESVAEEASDEPQLGKLTAIETATSLADRDTISTYLADSDVAVQAASFRALATQDKALAVESLLGEVNDPNQPARLQSLELLVQSPETDGETAMTALRNALHDPDPSFNAFAAEALAGSGNPDAMSALREVLAGNDVSSKLALLDAVAQTPQGATLLHEALSDSDAAVRRAAATLLHRPTPGDTAARP